MVQSEFIRMSEYVSYRCGLSVCDNVVEYDPILTLRIFRLKTLHSIMF